MIIYIIIFLLCFINYAYLGGGRKKSIYLHSNCIDTNIVKKAMPGEYTTKILKKYDLILLYNSVKTINTRTIEYYENKEMFDIPCLILNKLYSILFFGSKNILYDNIIKYKSELIGINVPRSVSSLNFNDNLNYPVICKPASGTYVGIGIELFDNKVDLINFLDKKIYKEYIIQEYIKDIKLFNNRKFHLRVYYLLQPVNNKLKYSVFNDAEIITALLPYNKDIINNKDITDSHRKSTDHEYIASLELDYWPIVYNNLNIFFEKITDMISKITNDLLYPNCKRGYEVYGCDFLVKEDNDIMLVEINKKSGFEQTITKIKNVDEKQINDNYNKFVFNHFKWIKKNINFY